MLKIILFLLAAVTLCTQAGAEIKLEISQQYRYVARGSVTVGAYSFVPVSLGQLRRGSAVDFSIISSRSLPYVIEIVPDLQLKGRMDELNASLGFWKAAPQLRPALLSPYATQIQQDGNYSAIIISQNWRNWFGSDTVQIDVGTNTPLVETERASLRQDFGAVVDQMNKLFEADFTVRVVPCGQSNAFSELNTGNILFCTERQADSSTYDDKSKDFVLLTGRRNGILFHEFGHSLLRRWRLPGADTEIIADQFALFMLLHYPDGAALARDWETWLRSDSNPQWETAQISMGSMHPQNDQRANQIRLYLDNPRATSEFLSNWSNLVYPHMRVGYLRRLAGLSSPRDLVDNARAELRRRGQAP